MKILLLTKKFPYPKNDGESVAIHNMVTGLNQAGALIDLLSFNTTKHYVAVDRYEQELVSYNNIHTLQLDNRPRLTSAFFNLFSGKSYHIDRFRQERFSDELTQILSRNQYDIIQIESIFLADYVSVIRKYTDVPVVLRTHNVEHLIWQRIVEHTDNPFLKTYLNLQQKRLKKYEERCLDTFDMILPMSQQDASFLSKFSAEEKIQVIPIFLDLSDYKPRSDAAMGFSFIGSLDWMPNVEGLTWFLEKVWPLVREALPEATMHIAGRNPVKQLKLNTIPGLKFHGAVPDAMDFINAYSIAVVPLLSGSGQKVKLLESMALSRAVVTTPIGVEGILGKHGESIMIASDEQEFARAMITLYLSESNCKRMGIAARNVVQTHYNVGDNIEKLLSTYKSLSL